MKNYFKYIKFQSPVIIVITSKLDFLKTVENELEETRVLNALRIYKIYTGLGLKEAKTDFDMLGVHTYRKTKKGRKKFIKGLKNNIIERNIDVLTREEFEEKSRG